MQTEAPGIWQIGEWRVDPALDTIARDDQTLKLEPRTMRLLLCLARAAGSVVSVDDLLTEVWSGVVVGSASVYQAVSQLRKLLGDVDATPTYIATVPRKGYRLIAPAVRLAASSPLSVTVPPSPVPTTPSPLAPSDVAPPLTPRAKGSVVAIIVSVVLITAVSAFVWKNRASVTTVSEESASIVVLPFLDLTAEKSDQAFCDGMTEELSNWLAQIPALRVVARTSAFAFRGKDQDVRVIGRALATNHVLEGSLRRSGNHARITVQLIDARNGYHLWSESFDIPLEDTIKVQEDISRSVARTLQIRLTPDAERQFASRRTANAQAYEWFLLGRHFAQQLTSESTRRAVDFFQRVVTADPTFAPGYTQLAYALLNEQYFDESPVSDVAPKVESLVAKALELDSRFSSAYAVRGVLRGAQSRPDEALQDLKTAITLNPSDLGAIAELGRARLEQARPRDALTSYDLAAALDPLNFGLQEQRCVALEDLGRYGEARQACERARELEPGSTSPMNRLAWLYEAQGKIDTALQWNAASLKSVTADDFDFFWMRADMLLSVTQVHAARAAIESGLASTHDNENAQVALVRVVYAEGGRKALRTYLDQVHLDQSKHAATLFEAAYGALLLGDAAIAKQLCERAAVAADRMPGYAESAWYARGARPEEAPYQLTLAAAELTMGERDAAIEQLQHLVTMLDAMVAAGVERHGTYLYRAEAFALMGREEQAMQDLNRAAGLGWRRVWAATHEPFLAALQQRPDFRSLIDRVQRSNDLLVPALGAVEKL